MPKILLFGQAQFGVRVMDGLVDAGHEIVAACPPPDRDGRGLDPVKERAVELGIRVVQRKSYKSEEAYDEVGAGAADLAVLAFVTQIIPTRILDAPRFASLCFHPSLLPRYRGGSAINWQIINGETRGGITLFRPDDGIDAGPIYTTKDLEIGPDESAGSYYYGTVFEPSVAAMLEAAELVLSGEVLAEPQDESLATHDPLCRDEHAGIDWRRRTVELHNLIRGCDPSPGAHCSWNGSRVRCYGSRRAASKSVAEPGTVVAVGDGGIEVATGDGSLRLAKLNVGAGKQPAAQAAAEAAIVEGARLGAA